MNNILSILIFLPLIAALAIILLPSGLKDDLNTLH